MHLIEVRINGKFAIEFVFRPDFDEQKKKQVKVIDSDLEDENEALDPAI